MTIFKKILIYVREKNQLNQNALRPTDFNSITRQRLYDLLTANMSRLTRFKLGKAFISQPSFLWVTYI